MAQFSKAVAYIGLGRGVALAQDIVRIHEDGSVAAAAHGVIAYPP